MADHISFAAPSQFQLQIVPGDDGQAFLTMLNAFDEPIGNLKKMQIKLADLEAIANSKAERVSATNGKATCEFYADPTLPDLMLAVDYQDPDMGGVRFSNVPRREFTDLIHSLGASA